MSFPGFFSNTDHSARSITTIPEIDGLEETARLENFHCNFFKVSSMIGAWKKVPFFFLMVTSFLFTYSL
jgi:hypothetical protein